MSKIALFQNERNWLEIKARALDLVERDHSLGLAQRGSTVTQLEASLAERFTRKYCITTGSCSDALTIAIVALGLPLGSRVAVSNYTFTASAHAVARAGHIVVPVDVDTNYCIDPEQVCDCDAVMAVDIFGNMSNWRSLDGLGIPVICDAAQSFESHNGSDWSVQKGLASCVSFSPSKTISSWGSGGALLTDDADIAEQARRLRLHGKINNGDISLHPGMNSMISSFEAACILAGLELSKTWQHRRQQIAKHLISSSVYHSAIDPSLTQHTLHKLVFQSEDRPSILKKFAQAEIDCPIHYSTLINDETLYHVDQPFPTSNRLKNSSFTVPNQHTLTDEEVELIAKVLE